MDWCFMSKRHMACELLSLIFCVFGVAWVMPYSVVELLASWEGSSGKQINVLDQKHNIFFKFKFKEQLLDF